LEALACEYEAEGRTAVLTTTTKIWAPEAGGRPLVVADSLPGLKEKLERVLRGSSGVSPVVGTRVLPNGKVDGLPPEWISSLRDAPGVEGVLIEADGANRLPLKAPAAHEPVVPSCSTLVVAVCGLDAQFVPLEESRVHRPEILAGLLGLGLGERVPPERLPEALVLGYAECVPRHARLLLYLNKADTAPPAPALVDVARLAPIDVWIGSLRAERGPIVEALRRMERRPVVVVLAAGLSSRMPEHKLCAALAGRSVLGRTVGRGAGLPRFGPVVVVCGHHAQRMREMLAAELGSGSQGTEWRCVVNERPEEGVSRSLKLAGECAASKDLLVLMGDQPLVRTETLGRLLSRLERHPRCAGAVLEPEGGTWGPPALINRALLPLFDGLEGDQGARRVLARYDGRLERVGAERTEVLDIDSPKDLEEAHRVLLKEAGPEG
jgi:molybdenum cofactor cytidylyltransferase